MDKEQDIKDDLPTLAKDIKQAHKELAQMRMAHALEPLKNPMAIRQKRRDIARNMTKLNQQKAKQQHP